MENNTKKKTNVFLYTIVMLFVFLFITEFVIYGEVGSLLYKAISRYPKGSLVISEAILAVMVLIVMLLFKNSYVFTQRKEPLKVGLLYGLFYLIGCVLFTLLYGVLLGGLFSGLSLINVFIGALLVGVCEEFLCRGWLLNEFLEKFGQTKKGVWYAIIVSGIIFGLIHLGNFFHGQNLVSTVTQILNASVSGIIYGVIYYKTRNIWSVILLHGLWDFSLFLTELVPITESTEIFNSFSVLGVTFSVLMILAHLVVIVPFVKDIDAKPKTISVVFSSIIAFFWFFVLLIINGVFSSNTGETYKYGNFELEYYSVTKDNYVEYFVEHTKKIINTEYDEFGLPIENVVKDNFEFRLSSNEDKNIVITNMKTKEEIEIECEQLYDFNLLEEEDYFILSYVDYRDMSNTYLYYSYINKSDLSNNSEYLENIKSNFKKYLLPERLELLIINDDLNNKKYLGAYDVDYGYFILTKENEVSLLNN